MAVFCWTKPLHCNDAFQQGFCYSEVFSEDSAQFASQKILFPASRLDNVSYRPDAQLSNALAVQTHIRLKHHPSGQRRFWSGPSSMSRSFELLQLASIQTIQQPVRTTLSVRSSFKISFQTQIWKNCCTRLDDVDSHLDALIHKASIAIQIQTSRRQLAWSGCT